MFKELSYYIAMSYTLQEIFPKFTAEAYSLYYSSVQLHIKWNRAYWDNAKEDGKQRRIQFLEYLKTTI